MKPDNTILNYINYYILDSDIEGLFKPFLYTTIFWAEVIAIILSLVVFYRSIIIQILAYYFLPPSLTLEDLDSIAAQKSLMDKYVDVKSKYELTCSSANTLLIRDKSNGSTIPALTLSQQVIVDCSNIISP